MPQNTLIKSQHTLSYFTRQLISFYRHQSFLLFSLLFVVSSCTLFSQGSVVTWGDSSYGGDSSSVSGIDTGVINIFSNERAFAALKSDGSVVAWGYNNYGGNSSSGSGAIGWGGIGSGVINIFSNEWAFAALKSDGRVVTWGNKARGGDSSSEGGYYYGSGTTSLNSGAGVTEIFSNEAAFAALKSDGTVVTWGFDNSNYGADSSSVASSLSSGVTQIFSNKTSFAALKSNGRVVTWGSSSVG